MKHPEECEQKTDAEGREIRPKDYHQKQGGKHRGSSSERKNQTQEL